MSTFKTNPPKPFQSPGCSMGRPAGHLARVWGGSSSCCPSGCLPPPFSRYKGKGKWPTAHLGLGFPAAKPEMVPAHEEAGAPSGGWAAPSWLVWMCAWAWGGGCPHKACFGDPSMLCDHPPLSNIPTFAGSKEGARHKAKDTWFCMQKSAG